MIPYYKSTKIGIGYIRETFNIVDDTTNEAAVSSECPR